jgi:hypothetical protein
VDQALARSLQHARNSAAEALLAARALMDALSILLANEPVVRHADANSPIAHVAEAIERWARTLRGTDPDPYSPGLPAIIEAVENEIARWEERARTDADARTVLQAFQGIREILAEFNKHSEQGIPGGRRRQQDHGPRASSVGAGRL